MAVCPYGCVSAETVAQTAIASSQDATQEPRRIAVRCDLCAEWRAEKGVEYTACMEACATRALTLLKTDGRIIEAPKPVKKEAPKAAVAEAEKKK